MASKDQESSETSLYPELDVQKLHALPSEQQDLYLLTFSSDLTRHVAALDADGASAQQIYVKKELFKVINLSSPSATRVIRNNLGQCFAAIFGKGDRKLLFESARELIALAGTTGEKDIRIKYTAVHCLGALFEAAGDSAISFSSLACATLLKQFKSAQNHAGLRAALFKSLGRIIRGVGVSSDEATVRDIWRQARNATNGDKSFLVQANACSCATQMVQNTPYLDNSSDFDRIQALVWKNMESSSAVVRRSATTCLAATLVKSYSTSPQSVTSVKKQKKQKKKVLEQDDVDNELERTNSPAPQKPVTGVSLGLSDILKLLSSQYSKTGSNRVRSAIALCYAEIFKALDEHVVTSSYSDIVRHFIDELLTSPPIANVRYRLLITRSFTRMIVGDVIGRTILGEAAQLDAIRFLVNGILKDYPQAVKERPEPGKEALVITLDLLTSLIDGLGSAATGVSDLCREGLLQVLPHFSHTVQVHASKCLQALVSACPQQLLPSVTICMNSVNREIGLLNGPRRSPSRTLGFAYGLAAALSTSSQQPLYGSVEVYSRILSQATSILKSSSNSDLRISSAQIQVAWILIGALMSLGPNFVKIHLSQLLMLWKNALPKPLSKDNIGNRSLLELSFLTHVRECALGSMQAFLTFNSRILTVDVSKRLAAMLQNTALFLSSLPVKKTTDDIDRLLTRSLQLLDYELMVRRRLYDCYRQLIHLSPQGSQEAIMQSNILSIAASSFANPVVISGGSLSVSIAASSTNFETIWELGDNSAFGLTALVRGQEVHAPAVCGTDDHRHWTVQKNFEAVIDQMTLAPTCGDFEHNSLLVYTEGEQRRPVAANTGVVDAAICLFATGLPLQAPKVQQGILEQINSMLGNSQNTARNIAITINLATALYLTMQVATRDTAYDAGDLRAPEVIKALQELIHNFISNPDAAVRRLGAEALGRLCKIAGSEFTSREVNYLIDLIVANREPYVRSGCATALGSLHAELGGMAAGYHLKNIVGVLSSLASDPHPTVHFWALDALCKVADSAGLAYSPFVSSTLGLLAQLYMLETHSEETSSLASSNLEVDLPTSSIVARCIDAMINALGPDLQDQAKTRNMILTLTYQFQMETSSLITRESLTCLEHLSMYAPSHISFTPYVRQLQAKMMSEDPDVRDTALTGLYNSMRKGAEEVLHKADPALEEQLWLALHNTYGQGIMRNIIQEWVEQSGFLRVDLWIKRIQHVLTRIRPSQDSPSQPGPKKAANGDTDLQDEEVSGFNLASETNGDGPGSTADSTQELLRWQVRSIALSSLHGILAKVVKESTTHDDPTAVPKLQPFIGDIVRIAFSASTAEVIQMRILGIQIIGQILHIFGRVPDPEFPEVTLLEQFQAQISSALTPAFASDSSPVLAAEAVGVCASFISTGIVTDVERMGRILRLLVTSLDDFSKDSESASIGDLKDLSSNAQTMVKLAIFSAWAELQIASQEHLYLDDVVRPHLMKLTPLWLVSLREYARLKFEPDVSSSAALSGGLDTIYAALNRETLLQFYQSSWLKFVDAIASLIDEDSDFVYDALDGKEESEQTNGEPKAKNDISYRDEPVAFFFVLFGIAFEALVSNAGGQSRASSQRTLEILHAMKKILNPAVAGRAIYQEAIFGEAMDLFDRLVLTESLEVQSVVVEIAQNLCIGHHAALKSEETAENENEEDLSDDIDQLFELTRILVLVISNHVPNVSEHMTSSRTRLNEESTSLIVLALTALVDTASVFPSIIKSDLHACILHVFATILSTPSRECQETLVPQCLPIFRRFIAGLARNPQHDTPTLLRSALARFLGVLKSAQNLDSEAALPCEKNTLLACAILLTSAAKILPGNDDLVTRFVDELAECLGSRTTAKVAAGLSRSLLLLPVSPSNEGRQTIEPTIISQLLPHLLTFVATPIAEDEAGEDDFKAETRTSITQTLVSFTLAVPQGRRPTALALVVPALLSRAATEGENTRVETSAALMELAGKDQEAFRTVVGQMGKGQRALVEEIIRAGAASGSAGPKQKASDDAQDKAPTIALKINF